MENVYSSSMSCDSDQCLCALAWAGMRVDYNAFEILLWASHMKCGVAYCSDRLVQTSHRYSTGPHWKLLDRQQIIMNRLLPLWKLDRQQDIAGIAVVAIMHTSRSYFDPICRLHPLNGSKTKQLHAVSQDHPSALIQTHERHLLLRALSVHDTHRLRILVAGVLGVVA
jgi:hypothetical protein